MKIVLGALVAVVGLLLLVGVGSVAVLAGIGLIAPEVAVAVT